jgi:hypothetical protein
LIVTDEGWDHINEQATLQYQNAVIGQTGAQMRKNELQTQMNIEEA